MGGHISAIPDNVWSSDSVNDKNNGDTVKQFLQYGFKKNTTCSCGEAAHYMAQSYDLGTYKDVRLKKCKPC